jgi:hypothetical protein
MKGMPEAIGSRQAPAGFFTLGALFFFGFTMASYAGVTLGVPGTALDRAWVLNPTAHEQLVRLGRWAAIPFAGLALALLATGVGWFVRRRWAWMLGVAIIAMNLAGNLGQLAIGERWKGAAGVVIAGLVLGFMTRRNMREYFRGSS